MASLIQTDPKFSHAFCNTLIIVDALIYFRAIIALTYLPFPSELGFNSKAKVVFPGVFRSPKLTWLMIRGPDNLTAIASPCKYR